MACKAHLCAPSHRCRPFTLPGRTRVPPARGDEQRFARLLHHRQQAAPRLGQAREGACRGGGGALERAGLQTTGGGGEHPTSGAPCPTHQLLGLPSGSDAERSQAGSRPCRSSSRCACCGGSRRHLLQPSTLALQEWLRSTSACSGVPVPCGKGAGRKAAGQWVQARAWRWCCSSSSTEQQAAGAPPAPGRQSGSRRSLRRAPAPPSGLPAPLPGHEMLPAALLLPPPLPLSPALPPSPPAHRPPARRATR